MQLRTPYKTDEVKNNVVGCSVMTAMHLFKKENYFTLTRQKICHKYIREYELHP